MRCGLHTNQPCMHVHLRPICDSTLVNSHFSLQFIAIICEDHEFWLTAIEALKHRLQFEDGMIGVNIHSCFHGIVICRKYPHFGLF